MHDTLCAGMDTQGWGGGARWKLCNREVQVASGALGSGSSLGRPRLSWGRTLLSWFVIV